MFSLRNMVEKYGIILNSPSYLELCYQHLREFTLNLSGFWKKNFYSEIVLPGNKMEKVFLSIL